jgi:hypothetical protein
LISVLSNLRLLCLESSALGEDWFEQSQKIDQSLHDFGMELAEESVYLLFDRAPGAVMSGEGNCLIARSVTGPKRQPEAPYVLQDWEATSVYKTQLNHASWLEVLEQAFLTWQDHQRKAINLGPGFILRLNRKLKPILIHEVEVIFRQ